MDQRLWFFFVVYMVFIDGSTAVPTSLSSPSTTQSPPQPAYQPQEAAASNYVPHVTYPYADGYGPISPYEAYIYPPPSYPVQSSNYMSTLIPAAQGALQLALRLFAKVGLFLFGGIALLLVGGLFTTAVCSITPICTITFNGLGNIDKDTVRALMTPEKISTAAALVQDAIGKYQRLQRTN